MNTMKNQKITLRRNRNINKIMKIKRRIRIHIIIRNRIRITNNKHNKKKNNTTQTKKNNNTEKNSNKNNKKKKTTQT